MLCSFDFQRWRLLFLNIVSSLCSTPNLIIADSIQQFQSARFISAEILSIDLFQMSINNPLQRFQRSKLTPINHNSEPKLTVAQGYLLISLLRKNRLSKLIFFVAYSPILIVFVEYDNEYYSHVL